MTECNDVTFMVNLRHLKRSVQSCVLSFAVQTKQRTLQKGDIYW